MEGAGPPPKKAAAAARGAPPPAGPAGAGGPGPEPPRPAPAPARRGPGRPPRKPAAPPLEKLGVVDSPLSPDNLFEFVYEAPGVFKHLFTFFKNASARSIFLRFTPRGLTLFARDHKKTLRIVVHLAGANVNLFYCERSFVSGLSRENVDKVFACIDKSFDKITFRIAHADPRMMIWSFHNSALSKEACFRIPFSDLEEDLPLFETEALLSAEAIAARFPLSLTLSEKDFKKTMSDIRAHSATATITRLGEGPPQFCFANPSLAYEEIYHSSDAVHLESSLPPGAIFRCPFTLDHIMPLASSMASGDVRIHCSESGLVLFRSAFVEGAALVVSAVVGA